MKNGSQEILLDCPFEVIVYEDDIFLFFPWLLIFFAD